jgi:hypothetical protein
MVKVQPLEPVTFEQIKSRLEALQVLVSSLKADDLVRAQKIAQIQHERQTLEAQLAQFKADLERAKVQPLGTKSETRVLN